MSKTYTVHLDVKKLTDSDRKLVTRAVETAKAEGGPIKISVLADTTSFASVEKRAAERRERRKEQTLRVHIGVDELAQVELFRRVKAMRDEGFNISVRWIENDSTRLSGEQFDG